MTVQLSRPMPLFHQQPGQNDCGPHAAAMAIGFYRPGACTPATIAAEIKLLRVPRLGATTTLGIRYALRRYGLRARGGWFTRWDTLRGHLAADGPVIVIVRPDDFPRCPWHALHYRVAVGYADDPALPGGGALFFNCSALPPRAYIDMAPGNVTIDYATFRRQWRTYLTWQWAAAVVPE